jgi:hypothetical protein
MLFPSGFRPPSLCDLSLGKQHHLKSRVVRVLIPYIMIALYHTSSNASKGIPLALAATNLTTTSNVDLAVSLAASRLQQRQILRN